MVGNLDMGIVKKNEGMVEAGMMRTAGVHNPIVNVGFNQFRQFGKLFFYLLKVIPRLLLDVFNGRNSCF